MSKYASTLSRIKNSSNFSLKVKKYGKSDIKLRTISSKDLVNKRLVRHISNWRRRESYWFSQQFKVTFEGTRKWLDKLVINNPDRVLFVIEDRGGKYYGHLGFFRYRARDNSCELDNVVRGVADIKGLMTDSVQALVKWGFENLGISQMYLTTFADNQRAVNLYMRCGFKITRKIPLKKIKKNNEIHWLKIPRSGMSKAKRFYVRMKYSN